MANLTELPNIGAHAAGQLAEVGIETPEDLVALGAEQAWLKLQALTRACACTSSTHWRVPCRASSKRNSTRPASRNSRTS